MFTDCFESFEIAHTALGPDATGQSPIFASIGDALAELQAGRMMSSLMMKTARTRAIS